MPIWYYIICHWVPLLENVTTNEIVVPSNDRYEFVDYKSKLMYTALQV